MEDLELLSGQKDPGEEMGDLTRISNWLRNLSVHQCTDDVSELEDVDEGQEQAQPQLSPRTPRRRHKTIAEPSHEETSPTNTTFSSIFDDPYDKSSSPCQYIQDNVSIASSISSNTWAYDNGKEAPRTVQHPATNTETPTSHNNPASFSLTPTSNNKPSTSTRLLATPAPAPLPRDPDHLHLITITSCLQCTLAGLPCSRSVPACTRCVRNGQGDVCLLHRRRLVGEIAGDEGVGGWGVPVLLRMRGETGGRWARKVEVDRELRGRWREARDRRNWVLPRPPQFDGMPKMERGVATLAERMHPGEGIGRLTHRELRIEL